MEFVSAGKRNLMHNYDQKRDEYLAMGVREYWIVDRFARCLTVHRLSGTDKEQLILTELRDVYTTRLLPGFEIPAGKDSGARRLVGLRAAGTSVAARGLVEARFNV